VLRIFHRDGTVEEVEPISAKLVVQAHNPLGEGASHMTLDAANVREYQLNADVIERVELDPPVPATPPTPLLTEERWHNRDPSGFFPDWVKLTGRADAPWPDDPNLMRPLSDPPPGEFAAAEPVGAKPAKGKGR
jgi:hypothetical protein